MTRTRSTRGRLPTRRRWRSAVALAVAIVLLAAAGGAAYAKSAGDKSAGADPIAFLNAPANATAVPAKPGPLVITPVTKTRVRLNWGATYPVPAGPIGDPNKTYTFCFSQGLLNNPWVTAQRESVMLEAARHPNLKVLYFNTNDANQQVQDLDTCHNKKVDAILVWPQSVGALTPAVNRLCKDKALVIGMERTVATRCYTSWLFLDYPGTVRQVAEAIAKGINYKGVVVESQGSPGSSPAILRHKYFAEVMKKYPKIKVEQTNPTDFGLTSGYNAAITFLRSPRAKVISAWYSHYEQEALGILAALKQVGRTDVKQYTIGGTRQVICQVQAGKIAYLHPGSATPLHGDLAVRLAIMKLTGKKIPANVLLSSPAPITPENAKEAYVSEGWGPGC